MGSRLHRSDHHDVLPAVLPLGQHGVPAAGLDAGAQLATALPVLPPAVGADGHDPLPLHHVLHGAPHRPRLDPHRTIRTMLACIDCLDCLDCLDCFDCFDCPSSPSARSS
eukprot:4528986-Prymnesium_polylepis.1